MQANQELSLHSHGDDDHLHKIDDFAPKISFEFTQKLSVADDSRPDGQRYEEQETESEDDEEEDDDESDGEDEEEEFSFASVYDDGSPIAADKVFQDGQIRPVFPLFNQDLLLGNDVAAIDRLSSRPPVDNVFIESPCPPSMSTESEEVEGVAAGPYCTWTKGAAPEFGKKSNSTGFSKLWRFKEKMSRSHSDGRDAFVFLNNSTTSSSSSSSAPSKREEKSVGKTDKSVKKSSAGDKSSESKTTGEVKVNKKSTDAGKVKSKKGGKKKVTSLSPHEVYMRSKLTEEDRRRSYLPYRPELMGFFTNVHGGGLSRNVHPF